jgi:lysophospholipid acyltransferase
MYFYGVFTTFATLAFFASPAKAHLRKMLEKRTAESGVRLTRSASTGSLNSTRQEPVLGLSADPGKDIDDAIQEIREEVEKARKDLNKRNPPKKEL